MQVMQAMDLALTLTHPFSKKAMTICVRTHVAGLRSFATTISLGILEFTPDIIAPSVVMSVSAVNR